MRKFELLGKALSRQEQKTITGGRYDSYCTCTGSQCSNAGETFYCTGDIWSCSRDALLRNCAGSGCGGSCGTLPPEVE